ncbi:cupin domain-containing protein [Halosegnis sp.]|uniref:cupin domain-containing protein n=1 Tax=Halosegnis sp. TaxID=2864959 RepID=UPI0035D4115E
MTTVTTGRTLDSTGEPVPGTGFELETDGHLAALLRERVGPLTSHPTRPSWAARLVDDDERIRLVSVFGPGYSGPPEHYHATSQESFDVRQGRIEFRLDGERRRVAAGERVDVPTDVRHTFRCLGSELGVVVTDIEPPGRIGHVLPTLGGLAHDETADAESPLQQAVIADRLSRDTVFTERDPRVTRPLAKLLAPVGLARGYRAAHDRYRRPAFWRHHVEQPSL